MPKKQRKHRSTKPMNSVGQVGLSSLFSCCQFHKYFKSTVSYVQKGIKTLQMQ